MWSRRRPCVRDLCIPYVLEYESIYQYWQNQDIYNREFLFAACTLCVSTWFHFHVLRRIAQWNKKTKKYDVEEWLRWETLWPSYTIQVDRSGDFHRFGCWTPYGTKTGKIVRKYGEPYSLVQRFPTCAPRSPKGSACTSQGLRGRFRKIK